MDNAIDVLQDRIIYLTGQITLIEKENMHPIAKKVVLKGWGNEIIELKSAQLILSNSL
jgi:hypothetical protein